MITFTVHPKNKKSYYFFGFASVSALSSNTNDWDGLMMTEPFHPSFHFWDIRKRGGILRGVLAILRIVYRPENSITVSSLHLLRNTYFLLRKSAAPFVLFLPITIAANKHKMIEWFELEGSCIWEFFLICCYLKENIFLCFPKVFLYKASVFLIEAENKASGWKRGHQQ